MKKEDFAFLHKGNVVGHYDGFIRALFRALILALLDRYAWRHPLLPSPSPPLPPRPPIPLSAPGPTVSPLPIGGIGRAALFFDPEMSFSRPRDWCILFSAAACLFFDLQLFFSPAMRPRKRAQSFFQPLCIILSSLFLGLEDLFSNPETSFSGPPVLFFDVCRRDAHTRRGRNRKSGIRELENKDQARKNEATRNRQQKSKNFLRTIRRKPHEKRFRGLKNDENKLKEPHARDNKNKHHRGESHTKSLSGV